MLSKSCSQGLRGGGPLEVAKDEIWCLQSVRLVESVRMSSACDKEKTIDAKPT